MMEYSGEIAAVCTAFCWTWTSQFFALAGQRIGSPSVNKLRILFALIILMVIHFIMEGTFFPTDITWYQFNNLALSGFIGFVIGDAILFEAFVLIGARLSMLLMSLVPIIGAIIAFFVFDEHLTYLKIVGVIITLGGILWVVLGRDSNNNNKKSRKYLLGIAFGIGGAICQAVGLIFAKEGMGTDVLPLAGTLIRAIIGVAGLWFYVLVRGRALNEFRKMRDLKATGYLSMGIIFGPVLGVTLSLYAVKHAHVAVATTLMQLAPVFLIPVLYFIYKEKITLSAIIGTIVAVGGAAILILSDTIQVFVEGLF
ncbi:MAG: DMT family transporter [Planctomycetes bacterium]|nr:DMT family transporter [Planctomycetota bacterium]